MKWKEFVEKQLEGDESLTEQFRALLETAGQPGVTMVARPCDGETLIEIDGIEVEPENMVCLALALRLVGHVGRKKLEAINVLLDYEWQE